MYASLEALGRNWLEADAAEITEFDDCARVTLRWNDGAYLYFIEENTPKMKGVEQARIELRRLGWNA